MTRVIKRRQLQQLDRRLGRHVHHDSESRRYAYRSMRPLSALRSIRHERHIPVLDQGSLGSCTGNAGIGCIGTGDFFATVSVATSPYTLDEPGAIKLYGDATRADPFAGEYPPTDTGSDGLTIAKCLVSAGIISGYLHAFNLNDALDALQKVPLITGTNWTADMFNPSREGIVKPTGQLAGGHEYVPDEFDASRGLVWFTNSWSTEWGVRGRFAMQAEDWGALLAQDGDVTVFVARTQAPPTPTPVPPARDAADDALFSAVPQSWLNGSHIGNNGVAARALKAWEVKKGYRR